jgi:hypothetical protein
MALNDATAMHSNLASIVFGQPSHAPENASKITANSHVQNPPERAQMALNDATVMHSNYVSVASGLLFHALENASKTMAISHASKPRAILAKKARQNAKMTASRPFYGHAPNPTHGLKPTVPTAESKALT